MKIIVKYLLSKLLKWQVYQLTLKKIKIIMFSIRKTGEFRNVDSAIKGKYKKLWSGFGYRVNTNWLKSYVSISGISDYRYIPENIYYSEIEPRLNNRAFSKSYTDKNNYHRILDNNILVPVLFRSINGVFYTPDYQIIKNINNYFDSENKYGTYIIKPSIEGGGGRDVRKIEFTSKYLKLTPSIEGVKDFHDLINYYKRDFVIQEYLEQDLFFRQFNSSSVNTIRVFTYRSLENEEIKFLHRILRIGKSGSIVDNQASGGIACGVNNNGVLSSFGVDKYGYKFYEYNKIKFSDVGIIPYMTSILMIAEEVAAKFLYSRLLSMDFAVNYKGKIFLIEVNDTYNEINFCQMTNGPLFGEYSEEVARLSHKEPKSLLIDYSLK